MDHTTPQSSPTLSQEDSTWKGIGSPCPGQAGRVSSWTLVSVHPFSLYKNQFCSLGSPSSLLDEARLLTKNIKSVKIKHICNHGLRHSFTQSSTREVLTCRSSWMTTHQHIVKPLPFSFPAQELLWLLFVSFWAQPHLHTRIQITCLTTAEPRQEDILELVLLLWGKNFNLML